MKIATFKNVECHYDDGSVEQVNQNDLLATNNNKLRLELLQYTRSIHRSQWYSLAMC